MSAALLLEYLGHPKAGKTIERSVRMAIQEEKTTSDLGGDLSTSQVGDFLLENLEAPDETPRDPAEQEANAS